MCVSALLCADCSAVANKQTPSLLMRRLRHIRFLSTGPVLPSSQTASELLQQITSPSMDYRVGRVGQRSPETQQGERAVVGLEAQAPSQRSSLQYQNPQPHRWNILAQSLSREDRQKPNHDPRVKRTLKPVPEKGKHRFTRNPEDEQMVTALIGGNPRPPQRIVSGRPPDEPQT